MTMFARLMGRAPAPSPAPMPAARIEPRLSTGLSDKASTTTEPPGWMVSDAGWGGQSRVKSLPVVTPDGAQRHATVYSCCNVVAGDLAKIPLEVWQRLPNGREVRVESHPAFALLNAEASWGVPSIIARFALAYSYMLRGRAYAWAPRDGAGDLTFLDVVTNASEIQQGRQRFYSFTDGAGVGRSVGMRGMVHLRHMALDGWTGRSPLQVAGESVALALAGQEAAGKAASGAHMRAVAKMEGVYEDDESYKRNARRLNEVLNDPDHRGIPIIGPGDDIKVLGLSAADIQLLESRKFDREQIAAIYRVPPSKLQMLEHGVKANGQQQAIDYKTDCLTHWAGFIEAGLAQGLFTQAERAAGLMLRHNYEALLEPTTKEKIEAVRAMVGGPVALVEEGRDRLGLPPLPPGRMPYPPPNMNSQEDPPKPKPNKED